MLSVLRLYIFRETYLKELRNRLKSKNIKAAEVRLKKMTKQPIPIPTTVDSLSSSRSFEKDDFF